MPFCDSDADRDLLNEPGTCERDAVARRTRPRGSTLMDRANAARPYMLRSERRCGQGVASNDRPAAAHIEPGSPLPGT